MSSKTRLASLKVSTLPDKQKEERGRGVAANLVNVLLFARWLNNNVRMKVTIWDGLERKWGIEISPTYKQKGKCRTFDRCHKKNVRPAFPLTKVKVNWPFLLHRSLSDLVVNTEFYCYVAKCWVSWGANNWKIRHIIVLIKAKWFKYWKIEDNFEFWFRWGLSVKWNRFGRFIKESPQFTNVQAYLWW